MIGAGGTKRYLMVLCLTKMFDLGEWEGGNVVRVHLRYCIYLFIYEYKRSMKKNYFTRQWTIFFL